MSRLWREYDECSAIALGELMDEWLKEHPADDENAAYDAVAFQVQRRAEEVFRERLMRKSA